MGEGEEKGGREGGKRERLFRFVGGPYLFMLLK